MIPAALIPVAVQGLNIVADFVSYWRRRRGGDRENALRALRKKMQGYANNLPEEVQHNLNLAASAAASVEFTGIAAQEMNALIKSAQEKNQPITAQLIADSGYIDKSMDILDDFVPGEYERKWAGKHKAKV